MHRAPRKPVMTVTQAFHGWVGTMILALMTQPILFDLTRR